MPGRFPIFKLLIYFLLHIDVFLTVLRFLAGITLKICEFQVRLISENTLIPFSRKQRHKGLTPRKKCQPFGVAYRSSYKLLFQELASDFRAVGKCS